MSETVNATSSRSYQASAARTEALLGNTARAKQEAEAALHLSNGMDVQYVAALALAIAGAPTKASRIMDDLARQFPEGTIAQSIYVSSLQAQMALNGMQPILDEAPGLWPVSHASRLSYIKASAEPPSTNCLRIDHSNSRYAPNRAKRSSPRDTGIGLQGSPNASQICTHIPVRV